MDSFQLFIAIFLTMIFADKIFPRLPIKNHTLKRYVIMMTLALTLTFTIMPAINDTFHKQLPERDFFIELGSLLGYFLISGLWNRKEIHKKMQISYYTFLGIFTYIFAATGIVTYWLLPFSKFAS
ncbi:MAG: hypothetical protein ACREBB_10030 [Nitrosotalea sp.]